jgi:murein DD-endopeptidase MepM/ murein hydrolase activator NlpD
MGAPHSHRDTGTAPHSHRHTGTTAPNDPHAAATPHSHRAPNAPLVERGRYAVAAALVAGVGVAGVTAASGGTPAAPAAAKAAARTSLTPSPTAAATANADATANAAAVGSGDIGMQSVGDGQSFDTLDTGRSVQAEQSFDTEMSYVAQGRKAKPPQWIDPMPEGAVTSCFGQRWGRLHAGVDLAAPYGTPVRAAGPGTVVAAGPAEGYGNAVLIDHGNGYLTHYGHMSAIAVQVGARVQTGDQVGSEGSTGHSTGPHLHFEVHQGSYQNPIEPTAWLREHGVLIPGCGAD